MEEEVPGAIARPCLFARLRLALAGATRWAVTRWAVTRVGR